MKFLILSDIHSAKDKLEQLLSQINPEIDGIIFSGDGIDAIQEIHFSKPVYLAKGNMDQIQATPFLELDLQNIKIAVTHGHLFDVKKTLNHLKNKTLHENFQLVIFGHTHQPFYQKEKDTVFMNPGAFINGEYAFLTLVDHDFYITFEELN